MKGGSAERQLAGFIAKFTPEIVRRTRAILEKMRARLPGSLELVYDNYNALAIGFGATERASDAIFSIAVFPRRVSLVFIQGVGLRDPDHRLLGSGKQVRYIVLEAPETLGDPAVAALMGRALERADKRPDPNRPGRIVIKSVSRKQRPRRPA